MYHLSGMAQGALNNPLPLSRRQVRALTWATARELSWGLPGVARETRKWARLAATIPDQVLRADAMQPYQSKRGHMAGAALFTTLPAQRSGALLQTLVTFQTIVDFLDNAHERHPTAANGLALHQAVVDALTPGGPLPDYYAEHPWKDDAGYLNTMVETCRGYCEALPSYGSVQRLLACELDKAHQVLTLNHLPDPADRNQALRGWAEAECSDQSEWAWFELTSAASGQLTLFVLLALAAKSDLEDREVAETYAAYWPVVPMTTNLLDSFVDQEEDAVSGSHQYVAYYPELDRAVDRMAELIESAARDVACLPGGHRHAVIFSCMVSYYLAKDSARTAAMEPGTKQLLRAGGSLPRALAPVLRVWRTAYRQRAA
jgi:tetraprenyl-beta-curcumene synthase